MMAMRLVWPDEEIMPKKRKAKAVDDAEQTLTDPVEAEAPPTERDTLEAQDGPIDSAEIQVEADEEDEEKGEQPAVDIGILEAMLFSTHHPLTGQRLAELLAIKSQKTIRQAVVDLNKQYEESGRTFRVEQVA